MTAAAARAIGGPYQVYDAHGLPVAVGEYLVLSDLLFRDQQGTLKVAKRGREQYVRLLADTIKTPDEIWEDFADIGGRVVARRRYVAVWQDAEQLVPLLTAFETGPQGWVGVTAFRADDAAYLERAARRGTRVYAREK